MRIDKRFPVVKRFDTPRKMDHSSREPSAELTASGDSDVTESSASSSISLDSASDIETDDASSGSGSDGELPTPRRAPAEEQPRERPRLALPVPRLDITGAGNEEARSRAPKLPVPALSIPVGGSDCGPGTPAFGGEPEVAIELLSPAFSVLSSSGRGVHGIQSDCATKLGVRQDRVRLFALVELNGNEAPPPGCHRVAVEVRGSGEDAAA